MTNLIETLKAETENFRIEYITQVTAWAIKEFSRIEELANSAYPVWANFQSEGWTTDEKTHQDYNPAGIRAIDYQQGIRYRKAQDARYNANNTVEKGIEAYVAKNVKLAEMHYDDSIAKLAARIEKKGLNETTLVVKTAHVGVNLEITLTDGTQIVRAFTIIASGPIQKPHYRYLIK